ncbi:MAG: hypothetical protein HFJ47_01545 [Clostridia bacterium]|nr:hypothetical protein [Clostridia bacterium]
MNRHVKQVHVYAEEKHACHVVVEESTTATKELHTILTQYGGNQRKEGYFFDDHKTYSQAVAELIFRGAWIEKCR